ncbi:hypothetical protein MTR_3g058090 [Medicago truncatula]|uniref:Protein FAR1-RELATED SEQUENCE n=1 Tax=Medicago truncatula TaxID=3880 RepID=G7IV00_MEDTR|nr:hypothetical protein MTR_3g058090 [Medicago truncatula]
MNLTMEMFGLNDVKVIPKKYILRRWIREARCGIVHAVSKFIRAATQGFPSEECLELVDNIVDDMLQKIMEFRAQAIDTYGDIGDFLSSDAIELKGFKKRSGSKGTK